MYVSLLLNRINDQRGLTILVDTRQLLGPVFGRTRLMTTDPSGTWPGGGGGHGLARLPLTRGPCIGLIVRRWSP